MNPEYQLQAQKLEELRRSTALRNALDGPSGSTIVDERPLREPAGNENTVQESIQQAQGDSNVPAKDPLIYPGVYSPSGIDMLSILIRVYNRPNPTIPIGSVDSAVALVLADAEEPDLPVVYCSEPFQALTGYDSSDVLGRNCRFLQYPQGGRTYQDRHVGEMNISGRKELCEKIAKGEEARVRLLNYRKDGTVFANLLTIIPIVWEGEGVAKKKYIVGFQADEGHAML
ncbi:hypothetical protein EG329_011271 [Mollisiaceae sp. DMI_Dod_QoI]|nr:hypothetical protein EG329_011271 [Helotiales sp. DMI_Dod_QoI]